MIIDVAKDYEGLRLAALELFREEYIAAGLQRSLSQAAEMADPDHMERLARELGAHTLAEGYFTRLAYIVWLEKTIELGAAAGLSPLLVDEIEGIHALRSARAEFARKHPQCPHCGELNDAFAKSCRSCHKEVRN